LSWLLRPDAPPTGIDTALISGQVAARDGQGVTAAPCGRVLRR
jgi:hypothetical protein